MKDIHIKLPDEEYEKLKRTAEDLGTSMSDIIATLLCTVSGTQERIRRIIGMEDNLK